LDFLLNCFQPNGLMKPTDKEFFKSVGFIYQLRL